MPTPGAGSGQAGQGCGASGHQERPATGSTEEWQATLAYWLECGIEFRSGERLEFFTPPSRRRGGGEVAKTQRLSTGAPSPAPGRPVPPSPPQPLSTGAAPPAPGRPLSLSGRRSDPPQPSPPPSPPPQPVQGVDLPWSPPLPAAERPPVLTKLAAEVENCSRCPLAKTRTQAVFGVGNPNAEVVFVGEGPGAEEDLQGEPFVGAAGRLLGHMLHAIGLQRAEVYIANVVKCRPPGNRNPHPEEIVACQEHLFQQLAIIRPKVIFCLGKFAILCLTQHRDSVGQARGKVWSWRGIPVIASFHPAYYLRTPLQKRAAWADLLRLRKQLEGS
ncbi:MAG: uracil-DNA glycosylase [Magnetococcales bacterium]|nr:uracil-DNA glycosylase [Magnetococcales bacterium]